MSRSVSFAADVHVEGDDVVVEEETYYEDDDAAAMGGGMMMDDDNPNALSGQDQQHQHAMAPPPPPPQLQMGFASSSSSLMCPNCGGRDIEQQDASGASVCTKCGVVVEENAIVSSVEFVEGAGGASSMVGQFVSATSSKAYSRGGGGGGGGGMRGGGRFGFSRDSRETTLANGRRKIQEVASRLRLGSMFVDAAHRLYSIAIERNFVQGRRTTHVIAACLYIACRQEKSQHMLIDFSDALQVNVYTLGTCFLKFRRLLGLKLAVIDPALYVYRFAAHLDLDEKANAVALTALRLVARMKRDWIVSGRRPAGICAAALLIAARAHGFSRQHQDVTRILKVCGLTVTSRVREFEQTSSARLTLEQFQKVDLETEADPPAYSRNKIMEARAKAIQEGNTEYLTSGALDDPFSNSEKQATKWRLQNTPTNTTERKAELHEMYSKLEEELQQNRKFPQLRGQNSTSMKSQHQEDDVASLSEKADDHADEEEQEARKPAATAALAPQEQLVVHAGPNIGVVVAKGWKEAYPNKNGKPIILPDHSTAEERLAATGLTEGTLNTVEWKSEMPESMESEFDCIFRTDEEELQKEAIFNKINKEYLVQQERKESERLNAEVAEKNLEDDDVKQAEQHARYQNSRSSRSKSGKNNKRSANDANHAVLDGTTEEHLLAAMNNRKISRKINYDALSSIFDDDGSLGNVDASIASTDGDDMYAMI